ncbi:hypothetical protein COLO4_07716 [Corchorus olitorius]|uniref:Uncharacterized protein n=1 Tax=Corchorus olitorius TaxID=93759 RepID=A0A1R3KIU0_9ROSI|nr:hypothetical protein COLO4_07716 [Corchorus olitorius]
MKSWAFEFYEPEDPCKNLAETETETQRLSRKILLLTV